MKKWLIGSLILIVFMFIAAGVHAQTLNKEKEEAKKCSDSPNLKEAGCRAKNDTVAAAL
jgi:hypothetical protein